MLIVALATAMSLAVVQEATSVDMESFSFNDHILSFSGPKAPELFEDAVIFTASSSSRRVGVAFAYEGYGRVHWFKKLMKAIDEPAPLTTDAKKEKNEPLFTDSGILFYVCEYPQGLRELEYRLVVDGLWTTDPRNPARRVDPRSGIICSVVELPERAVIKSPLDSPPGTLRFNYDGPTGQTITVGGNFNGWDPFMYELEEESPGHYILTLPLPPGKYRYIFYLRGERILDPNNPHKVYAIDGKTASEAIVR